MTRDEAKQILQAFRPGGPVADQPMFAEALDLARRDPELSAWLEEQTNLDAAIRRKLDAAAVPADLAGQIHAGIAARRARRRRMRLALAACVALGAMLAVVWSGLRKPEMTTFAACRQDMADFLKEFPRLDVETERLSEMRQWLNQHHALTRIDLPVALEKFPGIGCRTVDWRGQKLALICFMVDGEVVHLFVIPGSRFPDVYLDDKPRFARISQMTTASWQKGDVTFLALTNGTESFLRKYL